MKHILPTKNRNIKQITANTKNTVVSQKNCDIKVKGVCAVLWCISGSSRRTDASAVK